MFEKSSLPQFRGWTPNEQFCFSKSALFRILSPHSKLWYHICSQVVKQWWACSCGFKMTCLRSFVASSNVLHTITVSNHNYNFVSNMFFSGFAQCYIAFSFIRSSGFLGLKKCSQKVWALEEGNKTSNLTPTQTTQKTSDTKNSIVPKNGSSFLFIFRF